MKPARALWYWMCRPVRQPGQWLLGQAHHPVAGLYPFAVLGLVAYFGYYRPHWGWTVLVVYGVIALYVYLAGALAHGLWDRGRIWQDTICPTCDNDNGGGGGGWFDDVPTPSEGPDGQERSIPSSTPNLTSSSTRTGR
ncbi:hypothetical protein [Streptomyces sp. CFMR 7]|uniref:hypothetical protein n=1 Tax=Streptomyces sp. CFMR 7 TaxID=1649184 RepID=UPI000A70EFFC|nr:hypothetical protein [Streptomyces sp. CFMR 7]